MMRFKKLMALLLSAAMVLSATACSGSGQTSSAQPSGDGSPAAAPSETAPQGDGGKPVFAFVSKTTADPMFVTIYKGFEEACNEIGVEAVYRGTDNASAEKQIEIINQLVAQDVAALCVIAADFDALEPVLSDAMAKGIPVVSFDSAANPNSRNVHIEMVNSETLGRSMMRAAYDICGGEGKIGVLSGDPRVAIFQSWEAGIAKEAEDILKTNSNIQVLPTAYGYDLPDQSTTEAQAMLQNNPDCKAIVCATTVAILAAGKVIQDQGSDCKITGIGLPSEMAAMIKDGTCPVMFLWNPLDMGYLTAYAAEALVKKEITGAIGDKLTAGKLGDFEVTEYPDDGGTQILLGEPLKFDASNIDEYKDQF